jgi:hypothetical protein
MALFRRWLFIGGGLVALGGAIAACRSVNPVGAALTLRATIVLPAIACAAVPRLCGLKLLPVAASVGALTCVNCGLGILQNHLPADHLLNRYAGNETEVAVLESGVRATGTFAYITGLAVLSSVGIWAGLAMTSLAAEGLGMGAGAVTILASIGCGLASVSRGPLVVGAVLLASWAVFVSYRSGKLLKPFWTSALITLAGLVLSLVPEARQMTLAVLERHEQGEDTFQQRVFGQFSQAAAAAAIAPLGEGLGTEQVAGNYAAAGAMRFTTFEDQLPRLIFGDGRFWNDGIYHHLCWRPPLVAVGERKRVGSSSPSHSASDSGSARMPVLRQHGVQSHGGSFCLDNFRGRNGCDSTSLPAARSCTKLTRQESSSSLPFCRLTSASSRRRSSTRDCWIIWLQPGALARLKFIGRGRCYCRRGGRGDHRP